MVTDDERLTRLTTLARGMCSGAEVEVEDWHGEFSDLRVTEPGPHGNAIKIEFVNMRPPELARAFDMLEAALLVGNLDTPQAARLLAAMRELAGDLAQEGP
jgi:hypothetical protein